MHDGDVIPFTGSPRDAPRDRIARDSIRPVYLQGWDTDLLRSIVPSQQVINEDAGIPSVFEFLVRGSRKGDRERGAGLEFCSDLAGRIGTCAP